MFCFRNLIHYGYMLINKFNAETSYAMLFVGMEKR